MERFDSMEMHFFNNTHTHTARTFSVTLVPGMDADLVRSMTESYVTCGWELSAVHVHTDYNHKGPTVVDMDDVNHVVDLFEILETESASTTQLLAYGEVFGWDIDGFTSERYRDHGYFEGHSDADLAEEYYEESLPEFMESIHNDVFLSIDWDHTAWQLSTDGFYFHERNGIHTLFV